jgi:alkanesulfonate monooxygenase SsuD/methylene tetrahydromethanopterin reductase-like flavin-dependent oxidoreductase (luciferase family)
MNTSTPIRRGLGITAGIEPQLARDLAVRCKELGYHSLWSNDEPASPGMEMLAHFAAGAPELELGIGVLPVDRHQPAHIAAEISRTGLDPTKLWIGVGAG